MENVNENVKVNKQEKIKNIVVCSVFGVFLAVMFILCLFLPRPEYSNSERRKLAALLPLTYENVESGRWMTSFDSYSTDNFPFRDGFRTLKAVVSTGMFRRLDNNKIYVADGYAAAIEYPMKDANLVRASERFRNVYNTLLSESNKVYVSIIPDKGAFLAKENGRLSMDYDAFEARMRELTSDFSEYVEISDLLSLEDYYKTDTHWRQEEITDVADRLLSAMGKSPTGEHKKNELDYGFHGVYYGQSALPLPTETIYYLTNDALDGCKVSNGDKVTFGANGELVMPEMAMYDMELGHGKDPYEMYLGGSLSLVTVENPAVTDGSHLVLFRDSFGSAIAPLLCESYSKVTLVDIRYIQPMVLSRFVDFEGADVMFLYSTLVVNNSETLN